MWLRATLGVGLSVWSGILMIACGGGGSPSADQEAQTEKNPTDPAANAPAPSSDEAKQEEEPASTQTSLASASPTCAPTGSRVVLKLGMTADHRSVACYDPDSVRVIFVPNKEAKVTVMGPMSDGFCAIDVEVPKGAESGKIRIEVGSDDFETDAAFPVPCP